MLPNTMLYPKKSFYFLLTLTFSMISTILFAQDFSQKPSDWNLLKEKQGVKVYYKFDECKINQTRSQEVLLLKYENTTTSGVDLSWHTDLWYDGDCKTCNSGGEYAHDLHLNGGESRSDVCKRTPDARFQVLSQFLKKGSDTKLTKIELSGFQIQESSE